LKLPALSRAFRKESHRHATIVHRLVLLFELLAAPLLIDSSLFDSSAPAADTWQLIITGPMFHYSRDK